MEKYLIEKTILGRVVTDEYVIEQDVVEDAFINDDKMPRTYDIKRARAVNPFFNDLVVPVKTGIDTNGDTYEYEATPYVKHYCNYSTRNNPILKLPMSAICLFYYITCSVKWGEDWIWINRKVHKAVTGMAEEKNKKAVEYMKKNYKNTEISKITGLHINTLTKIKSYLKKVELN